MLGTATIRTYLTVGPDFDDLVCVYTSGRIVQCGKRRVVNHKQIDRRADKSPLRAACAPAGGAGARGGRRLLETTATHPRARNSPHQGKPQLIAGLAQSRAAMHRMPRLGTCLGHAATFDTRHHSWAPSVNPQSDHVRATCHTADLI